MSINGSTRRPSGSTSAFSVSSMSQTRPRHNSEALQIGHERVPYFTNSEKEALAHSTQLTAEKGSKSPACSTVESLASTSLSNSLMSPRAQRIESAKPQNGDLPSSYLRTIIKRPWIWEILALCFSLVCIGAITAVLALEDGKQVDEWGFQITPNAVVSFIATLAKSSFLLAIAETIGQLKWLHYHRKSHKMSDIILFDEASRGPWGSFQLLISKHKSTLLASIAASIILAALFVDPFVQLVFSFPSRRTLASTQNSSFQIASIYDPNRSMLNQEVSSAYMVDAKMLAAFLRGLYSGANQPMFSCPSGNCTWTDLTTLGICGECEDITPQVQVDCPGWHTPQDSPAYYACKYTMPSNRTLEGWLQSPTPAHTMWNSSAVQMKMSSSMDAKFATVEAIQLGEVITTPDGTRALPPPKASRCTFAFCAKTYSQINVTNGALSISIPEEKNLVLGTLSNESCLPSECTTPLYQNMVSPSRVSDEGSRTYYSINHADYQYITVFITNMFSTGWGDLGLSDITQYGRPLAFSENLNKTAKSIAASMTEIIRTGPNSTNEVGVSYVERTFIVIRWGYLSYPIALVLLTIIVLTAAIIETRKHDVAAWKNSALALVFHELRGWDLREIKMVNVEQLDRRAAGMKGMLLGDGDIPAFSKTD